MTGALAGGGVAGVAGQQHGEGRAAADGLDAEYIAAGLLDDAVDHGEAKTRAFADLLRREERLEDLVLHLRRDAMAEILDLDRDIFGRGQRIVVEGGAFGRRHIAGAQRDLAAVRHGVARIDDQIDDDLFELIDVGLDEPEIAAVPQLER